ncbi:MAG: hypothetical protein Kow00105_17550 [Phycisphaeraceae bacterium]
MFSGTRWYVVGLFAVFLIALSVRIGLTGVFVGFDAPPDANANSDQVDYEVLAYHLVSGQGYAIVPGQPTATRTPGTSLTLAGVYALTGRSFTFGRVWFCVLSALTCVLVVWLGATCFSRPVGVLAGFLLAIYPAHAYNAMHFVSETPFGFWLALGLVGTMKALHSPSGRWVWHGLAGACWALAVLTRPQLLLAVPIAGVMICFAGLCRRWSYVRVFAVQVLVLVLLVSPWVIRNAVVLGKPTLSTITGYGLWGAHNERTFTDPQYSGGWVKASELIDAEHPLIGNEVERNDMAMRYGMDAIRAHLDQMPGLIVAKLWRMVSPFRDTDNRLVKLAFAAGWLGVGPWVMFGLLIAVRQSPASAFTLLLPILAVVASVIIFYGSDRFRDSVAPVFVIPAAYGMQVAGSWMMGWLGGLTAGEPFSRSLSTSKA